ITALNFDNDASSIYFSTSPLSYDFHSILTDISKANIDTYENFVDRDDATLGLLSINFLYESKEYKLNAKFDFFLFDLMKIYFKK
ncbi:9563_t:CDS:1, partial [Funneliformis geosporum]